MTEVLSLITDPLGFPFMIRGIAAAVMVGAVSATVGTFVVLRGMAFFGDALAHAILPGLAVGYLLTGGQTESLFWWALFTALVTSVSIGFVSASGGLKEDTAIGIVFAGMFALGIALISTVRSYAVDLSHILFGNVLGVSTTSLVLIASFGALVLVTILLLYKEFVVMTFDPTLALTMQLPTTFLHYALLVLIAATTVVSLQTVGVALMLAMMVTPAATAYLLTRRLPSMMALAAAIGALSGIAGIYLSFYLRIASGAAIVLVATGLFALAFTFSRRHGWFWRVCR